MKEWNIIMGLLVAMSPASVNRIRICVFVEGCENGGSVRAQVERIQWEALRQVLFRFGVLQEAWIILDQQDGIENYEEWVSIIENTVRHSRVRVRFTGRREFLL